MTDVFSNAPEILLLLLFSVVNNTITASILNQFLLSFFDVYILNVSIFCNIIFLLVSIIVDTIVVVPVVDGDEIVAVVIVHTSIAFRLILLNRG
ncbi:Hypothetical predicted protein [Octopus vulgaris]|uniref:Uncharacterized protein n=1 Tax=Octopus vulgaris TaxID=6645 RepID=A0AA36AXI2_OCTVU|nr:Hypothetical predicted protein [Octopus vulgaris]